MFFSGSKENVSWYRVVQNDTVVVQSLLANPSNTLNVKKRRENTLDTPWIL